MTIHVYDVQSLDNTTVLGTTSTATAAGTTTLTIASSQIQVFTGSTTQTVKLPTTSVPAGHPNIIVNQSSGAVTVQSSGGNTIATLAANTQGTFVAQKATPTAQNDWAGVVYAQGKALIVDNGLELAGTDGTKFTFPSTGGNVVVAGVGGVASTVVEYTTTQTGVSVPAGVTGVWIEALIGPGGGGGSGMRGAAGGVRGGGSGGGGGGMIANYFVPVARLGSTFTLTLPAAGTGGAAVTTDGTNGNPGALPAAASFVSGSFTVSTGAGTAAGGGTNAGGAAGLAGFGQINGANGGSASATGGVGANGAASVNGAPTGGGAGGGITSGDSASGGGYGSQQYLNYGSGVVATPGVVDSTSPGTGQAAQAGVGGIGGGGGAASITTTGQTGATPTGYGAGGGGGGSSLNGHNSGAGGNGGGPYARLRWEYI